VADKPTCKTCPYWEHYDKDEDVDVGLCRRLSPKTRDMTELSAGTLETVWWPRTADFDWCGEHPEIISQVQEKYNPTEIGRRWIPSKETP